MDIELTVIGECKSCGTLVYELTKECDGCGKPMPDNLKSNLERSLERNMEALRMYRTILEQVRQEISEVEAKHSKIYNKRKDILDAIRIVENTIREGGNKVLLLGKELPFGLKLKHSTVLDYDPQVALVWAIEHKLFLLLDRKSFEKYAKDNPLQFVTIKTEAMITIPSEIILDDKEPSTSANETNVFSTEKPAPQEE